MRVSLSSSHRLGDFSWVATLRPSVPTITRQSRSCSGLGGLQPGCPGSPGSLPPVGSVCKGDMGLCRVLLASLCHCAQSADPISPPLCPPKLRDSFSSSAKPHWPHLQTFGSLLGCVPHAILSPPWTIWYHTTSDSEHRLSLGYRVSPWMQGVCPGPVSPRPDPERLHFTCESLTWWLHLDSPSPGDGDACLPSRSECRWETSRER